MESRIVVGVEGSGGAKEALKWAINEAKIRGAKIQAVTAYAPTFVATSADFNYVPLEPLDLQEQIEKMQEEVVASALEESDDSVEIEKVLMKGRPADTLIKAAEGADMLVVGSRGRGGFKGLMLGSVSQQIVQHCDVCPVVIVRSNKED